MCPRTNDSETYSKCAASVFKKLLPHMAEGIPSIKVPVMEPLVIPSIESNRDFGMIHMKFKLKNYKIYGLTNSTIDRYKINLDKLYFVLKARAPVLLVTGNYSVDGYIFFVPLAGSGRLNTELRK